MTEMMKLVHELWYLKRDIVSDGFDDALSRLSRELPMTIHEYPTGTPCWTWKIPEKWTCDEAFIESLDGRRIIDVKNHPLHIVSYSLPFEGIVKREDLLPHLHTHKRLPDAIPFVFKYYDREWGLCLSQTAKSTLKDDLYRVVVRTRFEQGTLKVGEVIIPGESGECFVLAAHLCHPAMVNDDLTGCVVGLDVARCLLNGPKPYYTYRLLILPETIGSVAWLSHHEELIPQMAGGLFLEMLGTNAPHSLQHSLMPSSPVDRCFETALKSLDPNSMQVAYRQMIWNDERHFNAPGVRTPMLSISRCILPKTAADYPYYEYHSSFDTPEIISQSRLEASRDLILQLLWALEKNHFVVNQFKGEIFCSGFKIWIDPEMNPEGYNRLFEVMEKCDGTRRTADIATELQISFQAVWEVVEVLLDKQLVRLNPTPASTEPIRI
jgi:aminopeptidase-like protein